MSRLRLVFGLALVLAIAAALVASGIFPRLRARAALRTQTNFAAEPVVSVTHPKFQKSSQELVLPGNIQAFTDAPIYARTSGYLRKWYADIGAHVKSGELLAEIEAPEIEKQLEQARADVATAEANLKIAETTATRYEALLKMD